MFNYINHIIKADKENTCERKLCGDSHAMAGNSETKQQGRIAGWFEVVLSVNFGKCFNPFL